jgi:hypothetical protein
MSRDVVIAIICGVVSNLVTLALVEALKWQIKKLKGDLSGVRARISFWFYRNLNLILLTGMLIDAFFLTWLLIKFPRVSLWTVFAIVLCVVLTAFQLALFMLNKMVVSILDSLLKFLKNLVTPKDAAPTQN